MGLTPLRNFANIALPLLVKFLKHPLKGERIVDSQNRQLTLAQQDVVLRKPEEIGIEKKTTQIIKKTQRRSKKTTNTCLCKNLSDLPLVKLRRKYNQCSDIEHWLSNLENENNPDPSSCLVDFDLVICYINIDLDNLDEDCQVDVRMCLACHNLVPSINIEWIPQQVLTLEQQELMEGGLYDLGLDTQICEALGSVDIITLNDLLNTPWPVLEGYAKPSAGIPYFGKDSLEKTVECLDDNGFLVPPGTTWVLEQNTTAYAKQNIKNFFPHDSFS